MSRHAQFQEPKGEVDVPKCGPYPTYWRTLGNQFTLRNHKHEAHFNFTFQLQPLILHKKSGFITGWLWNPTFGNMFIRFLKEFIYFDHFWHGKIVFVQTICFWYWYYEKASESNVWQYLDEVLKEKFVDFEMENCSLSF